MSSLICYTDESQILLATDTLATLPDGRPFKFATKALIVPNLKLIMAGIGMFGFLNRWFLYMNEMTVVTGIDALNYHTSRALVPLWQRYKQELSVPDTMQTTIYHFGFSEVTGLIHSYAYRSVDHFISERLEPYGLRIKPACPVPANYCLPHDLRKMMDDQRAIEASKPKDQKIYIGGEIEIHYLSKNGFRVCTFDRFEDYAQDEKAIYDNFRDSMAEET
jgi:hypothetical protein